MPRVTYLSAALQAVREEMRNDPRVFVMGEDVQAIYGPKTLSEFGPERIRNTPISETGFFGAGIGAALTGLRPVIEAGVSTFLYSGMDQIVSQAAKTRYMFGGQASVPIVIRATVAYASAMAAHHSDRPWGLFAQVPGLKIVVPATAHDMKGLLKSALRDDNPVLCLEDITLSQMKGEVPAGDYTVPIGLAQIRRPGADVTLVALAGAVHHTLSAAQMLDTDGISAEVVDLRTVVPLDRQTILQSVTKTGRLVVVDPAPGMCSVGSEVAATVAEHAFARLQAPVVRLNAPDVPVPFSQALEPLLYPTAATIAAAARRLCSQRG